MTDPNDAWPDYYSRISREHLHAVGVLIAAWNEVEVTYSALLQLLLPHNVRTAVDLFYLLGNQGRWEFISDESRRSLPSRDADNIAHFLKCAAICKENRNAIAHATHSPQEDPDVVMLTTTRDRTKTFLRQYWFSVPAVRQMADETHATAAYGMKIFIYVTHLRTEHLGPPEWQGLGEKLAQEASSERPPLPRKWDLHSLPNPAGAEPPPESSAE